MILYLDSLTTGLLEWKLYFIGNNRMLKHIQSPQFPICQNISLNDLLTLDCNWREMAVLQTKLSKSWTRTTHVWWVLTNMFIHVVKSSIAQSCSTLRDTMNYSPPDSSDHGILLARLLEGVTTPFSRGSSQPRDGIQVSRISGSFFTIWATRKTPCNQHPNQDLEHFINPESMPVPLCS